MRYLTFILAIFLFPFHSISNDGKRLSRGEYIDQWKDEAIYQMVIHKIPASITLAQGILESADGNSELARKANNHFGIKCHSDWKGKKTYHDDDRKGECFRHYRNANESFEDHSLFLQKPRYAQLFDLKITDYKGWAKGLKKCGYATNRQYANLLIRIIEDNDLEQYDKQGIRYIKKGELPNGKTFSEPLAQREDSKSERKNTRKHGQKDLPKEINLEQGRMERTSENNIRYVLGKEGDSVESLANELEVMPWQLKKYNDLGSRTEFGEDEMIYLQPKRNRSRKYKTHTVKEGESIRYISQKYGVKIKKILRRNDLDKNAALKAGMTIRLR